MFGSGSGGIEINEKEREQRVVYPNLLPITKMNLNERKYNRRTATL